MEKKHKSSAAMCNQADCSQQTLHFDHFGGIRSLIREISLAEFEHQAESYMSDPFLVACHQRSHSIMSVKEGISSKKFSIFALLLSGELWPRDSMGARTVIIGIARNQQ